MGRWSAVFACAGFLPIAACERNESSAPPRAPDAVQLAAPAPYTAASNPQNVCTVDPAACPSVDLQVEARRPAMRENVYAVQQLSESDPAIHLSVPLAAAPAVRADRRYHSGEIVAEASPTPPSPIDVKAPVTKRGEMLDIEAHVSVEVPNIQRARAELARMVGVANGQVVNEVVEDQHSARGASLSIRVPSNAVQTFVTELARLGKIRSQKLETRDVSRTVNDAEILLSNLERALERYQELLAKAANVTEALAIEAELQRVRTSLERVRGDLEWMRDRVARSTVYVTLSLEDGAETLQNEAKVHPGVRGVMLFDVPPSGSARSFAGAGLSLGWGRSFSIDLDLMKRTDEHASGSINSALLTMGGELYSDFLGGGRRRWLNPYFGLRLGYGRLLGENALVLGGDLGLEIFKTSFFLLELQGRAHALIGPDDGVHGGIEPILGMSFAY